MPGVRNILVVLLLQALLLTMLSLHIPKVAI